MAGEGKTLLIDGRIFCLELEVGIVNRRAIGFADGVVGLVGGTAYVLFLSASCSRGSGFCLALDAAVGALNLPERAERVEDVEGVPDEEDGSAREAKLALRGSFGGNAGPVGLVEESCNRPSDF